MNAPVFVEKSLNRLGAQLPLRYQINALTKLGRKQLLDVLSSFFDQQGLNKEHVFAIHYALVEIVFNALKANLKFVAFREEVRKQLDRFKIAEIDDLLQVIIEERTLREYMAGRVVPDVLKRQVRQIFDLEEKYRTGMAMKLNEEQIALLKRFRLLVRDIDADVNLQISNTPDEIGITVTNRVPMLQRDLERIEQSRMRHHELHKEGRSGDFFSYENLDTTESAGFGIAMVDQGIYKLGLNPFEQLKIQSKSRETIVKLVYPRRVLKNPTT